jgi:hypothetical protein
MLAWHEYVPNADTQVRLTGMVQRAAADVGGAGREINNDDTAVSKQRFSSGAGEQPPRTS